MERKYDYTDVHRAKPPTGKGWPDGETDDMTFSLAQHLNLNAT